MKNKLLSDAVKMAAQKPIASTIRDQHKIEAVEQAKPLTAEDYLFGSPDIPMANTGGTYQYIDDVLYFQSPYTFEWSKAKSFTELKQKYALRIPKNNND